MFRIKFDGTSSKRRVRRVPALPQEICIVETPDDGRVTLAFREGGAVRKVLDPDYVASSRCYNSPTGFVYDFEIKDPDDEEKTHRLKARYWEVVLLRSEDMKSIEICPSR